MAKKPGNSQQKGPKLRFWGFNIDKGISVTNLAVLTERSLVDVGIYAFLDLNVVLF